MEGGTIGGEEAEQVVVALSSELKVGEEQVGPQKRMA